MMRAGAVRAGLAMAGIFALGLFAGTVAGRAWALRNSIPVPPNAREFTARHLQRITKDLSLTDEQVARMRDRMESYAERIRTARREAFEEVQNIYQAMNTDLESELTPDQVVLFRAYLEQERERFLRDGNRRRGGEPGGPPPPAKEKDDTAPPPKD